MRTTAFWDTSALLSLCVKEQNTPWARAQYEVHEMVVWWATPVELASALSRLVRLKELSSRDLVNARKLAGRLAETWAVVQPSNALRTKALQMTERFPLRAADSLQLAAALEWCEGDPHGRIFLTADEKLRQAAARSGFDAPDSAA